MGLAARRKNPGYTFKRKPRVKQAEALALSHGKDTFALLMQMRCVDGDTEYLSPTGWKKMTAYTKGELVAEFRLDGTAHFVKPLEVIKVPVDKFWHFETQGAVDQVLSQDHRILLCTAENTTFGKVVGKVPDGFIKQSRPRTDCWLETSPRELLARESWYKRSHAPVTFTLKNNTQLNLSDDEIRLMVAFHADGSYNTRDISKITASRKGVIRIKRERKKQRLRQLLARMSIQWEERKAQPRGFSRFIFTPPRVSKTYGPEWWAANEHQRQIIVDEVVHWDAVHIKNRHGAVRYSSNHEQDADFIQYCFVSTGTRASKQRRGSDGTVGVYITGNGRTTNLVLLRKPKPYRHKHDGYMYSFSVPSTYLVFRRNGKVFVSGNTGKSKVIIDDFGMLVTEGKAINLLIIAPAGAYRTWETALADDLNLKALVYTWDSSTSRKDGNMQTFMKARGPRVLLMNVEALSTIDDARDLCTDFCKSGVTMTAIDESVCVKNGKAKRTKFVMTLAPLSKYRRILSGLPTPKSPLDLYAQFEFLGPWILGFDNYDQFFYRHAITRRIKVGKRNVDIVVNYKNLEELQKKIAPYSFRVTLDECYDLPASTYTTREVPMTREQERIYQELLTYATAELTKAGSRVTVNQVVTQILRLHQLLCGYSVDEDGNIHEIPEKRTDSLIELLEDTDGKAIIWCAYDYNVRKISEALMKHFKCPVARFWGGNKDTREAEEKNFKSNPDCRFMIATAAAGGRGRTWDCANTIIYHSNSYDLDHRLQSEERAKNVGKLDPVLYVDLVTPKTVDTKILQALRNKLSLSDVITGDSWREWVL